MHCDKTNISTEERQIIHMPYRLYTCHRRLKKYDIVKCAYLKITCNNLMGEFEQKCKWHVTMGGLQSGGICCSNMAHS